MMEKKYKESYISGTENLLSNTSLSAVYSSFLKKMAIPLLLSTYFINYSQAAISVHTVKAIQGTAPAFNTDLVSMTDFKYFGVNYNGNSYYDSTLLNNAFSALNLSAKTNKPSDITGLSLASFTVPATGEVIDTDGDNVNPMSITATQTDSVTMAWYDVATDTALTSAQLNKTFCELSYAGISPYIKVFGSINLNTQYGNPHQQTYPDALLSLPTPKRSFPLKINPIICSAMPDPLSLTAGTAGPATEWSSTLGFLPQESGNNFPTTGAKGLYFDLVIAGIDVTTLDWSNSVLTASNSSVILKYSPTKITVTLDGPFSKVKNDPNNTPSDQTGAVADKFIGPASFNIQGKDKDGNIILKYPFTINKWFINRSAVAHATRHITWCNELSGADYSLAGVRDMTNSSVGPAAPSGFPLPLSSTNNFTRRIGAGLATEWGWLSHYNNGFQIAYWTSDQQSPNVYYSTAVNTGDVRTFGTSTGTTYWALCRSN